MSSAKDAPVYDERGNVRPHGTEGARPMSYAERVKIAERLAAGEVIHTTAEKSTTRTARAAKRKS